MNFTDDVFIALHSHTFPTAHVNTDTIYYTETAILFKKYNLTINNLFISNNSYIPFIYLDFDNYIFLTFDFCASLKDVCNYLQFANVSQQIKQLRTFIKNNKNSFFWLTNLVPTTLSLYIFEQIYLTIPEKDLFNTWYKIYQKVDFCIDSCNYNIVKYVINHKLNAQCNKIKNPNKLLKIYHGANSTNNNLSQEISWTTSLKIADFFANRFNTNTAIIYQGFVLHKDAIILPENQEHEVLCFFENVQNVSAITK